jgi:hypothetical protein
MAAFAAEDPSDKEFHKNQWTKIVVITEIRLQTLRFDNRIVEDLYGCKHQEYSKHPMSF